MLAEHHISTMEHIIKASDTNVISKAVSAAFLLHKPYLYVTS
jgi:hypothetical protein